MLNEFSKKGKYKYNVNTIERSQSPSPSLPPPLVTDRRLTDRRLGYRRQPPSGPRRHKHHPGAQSRSHKRIDLRGITGLAGAVGGAHKRPVMQRVAQYSACALHAAEAPAEVQYRSKKTTKTASSRCHPWKSHWGVRYPSSGAQAARGACRKHTRITMIC